MRPLARGGFGVVYEARHVSIEGHRAAIKLLHKEHAGDPEVQRRFTGEANAASRIAHPNIVQIFDAGTTAQGSCFLVMEFLDGKPLSQLFKQQPLPPERTARILAQVASALAAAHDKGIIHRDLKPDNIIVLSRPGGEDLVKVLDFGIAKLANETGHTRTGTLLGTPYYMSPEQWESNKSIDGRADIYSLAIILYECLTGAIPFSGETALQCMYAHLQKPLPDPAERVSLPGSLRELLLRMASKSAADRPASMQEVEAALRAIAEGKEYPFASTSKTHSARLPFANTLRSPGPHSGRRRLLATLVAIAVVGALFFGFRRFGSQTRPALPTPPLHTPALPPQDSASPTLPKELVVLGPIRFAVGNGPASADDGPAHFVEIARFALSRLEVSFSELAEYQASSARKLVALQGINLAKFGNRPAVNLTRDEAAAYCRWRYSRFSGRLPSEAEWELAARSADTTHLLPWSGTRIEPQLANLGGAQPRTFPVESFETGASAQGILHLIGNAAEWTSSDSAAYPGSSAKVPRGLAVVRGGGANLSAATAAKVRATTRFFVPPTSGSPYLGFRCAATP